MKTANGKRLLISMVALQLTLFAGACASDDPQVEDSTNQPARLLRDSGSSGADLSKNAGTPDTPLAEPAEASNPDSSEVSNPDPAVTTSQQPVAPDASQVPAVEPSADEDTPVSPDVSTAP